MSLREKWYNSPALRVLGAAVLNAAVLALTLLLIAPGFESNDDLALAAFVDGQMSVKCAHIPYINYLLGLILKGVYTVLGEGFAWHTIGQYLLLFAGFTAISWTLLERLRFWQGALVSVLLLAFFGVDTYTLISYTKTAAVATVGGLALMVCAMETREKGRRALPVSLGIVLALFGFMLRYMEFLPCAALTAVLGLYWLIGLIQDKSLAGKEKLRRFGGFIAPFVLLLALVAGLFVFDTLAWSEGRWGVYDEFDATRVALTDYGIPEYKDMPEQYESLGLNENAVALYRNGNFFDTEKFGRETMAKVIEYRSEIKSSPTPGECLGKLLDKCVPGFFVNLHIYGFLLLALLWLACGEHDLRGWLTLLAECGLFALFYMYLIYRGRYLIDRVDVGLFLAAAVVFSRMLRRERMDSERVLSAVLLCSGLCLSLLLSRDSLRFEKNETAGDKSEARAAVETILEDTEHLYLAKLDTVSDTIYTPFEPAAAGYGDRIVLMGGWDFGNPAILDVLSRYGVENPYRDIVGNDKVYMIEDDIEATMEYIHDYYDPDATAELAESISSETGLQIYRILN